MKFKYLLLLSLAVLLNSYMTNSMVIKGHPDQNISTTSAAPRTASYKCFLWNICVKPIRKQSKQELNDLKVLEAVLESYPRFRFIGKKI